MIDHSRRRCKRHGPVNNVQFNCAITCMSILSQFSPCCHVVRAVVLQGAVAVEGEAHLWRPGRRGNPASTPSSSVLPAEGKQDGATPQDTSAQQQDLTGVLCCGRRRL